MKLAPRTVLSALALAAAAGLAVAGPLNPPAGPVTSTMKTLAEVEPRTPLTYASAPGDNTTMYRISASGSYYLTQDIWVPPGVSGITIAQVDVTIDLNGFMLSGLTGSHEGITTTVSGSRITIKNGTVTGFGVSGVNLASATSVQVRDVTSSGNHTGISVGADSSVVSCRADHCYVSGFAVGDRCTVTGCVSSSNLQNGFTAGSNDTFRSCTASENSQVGFYLGAQNTIGDCQSLHNTLQGIVAPDNCGIIGNQCRANGGTDYASIWTTGDGNTIQNNQTTDSGYGVWLSGNHNTVCGNTFSSPAQRAVVAQGTNNLIIQNTMHNTIGGIQAVAFNRVGAILQPNYNPQLISGTSGGGLGITDPFANLLIN